MVNSSRLDTISISLSIYPIYLSIYPSIYLTICLFLQGSTAARALQSLLDGSNWLAVLRTCSLVQLWAILT